MGMTKTLCLLEMSIWIAALQPMGCVFGCLQRRVENVDTDIGFKKAQANKLLKHITTRQKQQRDLGYLV
jgi:hypothetical protein